MQTIWIAALSTLPLLSGPSTLLRAANCAYSAERTVTVAATGAEVAHIIARAGSLRIQGRPGLQEVRVRGQVCASSRRYLDETRLAGQRSGDHVRVEVTTPELNGGRQYARMDLVVEVPESLHLDVRDSSGEAEIHHVATLRVEDSSGGLKITDVRGDLSVTDSSGEVEIDGVRGDLWLRDSSGGLRLRQVSGSVLVEQDSSGDIDIRDVAGQVAIRQDSSGDIYVAAVQGDFTVARDGSGGIRYRDVGGQVRVPERKR